MNTLDFLTSLHSVCHFQTKEGKKTGRASNSELRRWFLNGAVVVNGRKVSMSDDMPKEITSFVLFPKNPITLW